MPLPKDMGKCMSKVKDEFPEGRSDKKKSKKAAHKQHVAICLNVKENFTFKDFLLNEAVVPTKPRGGHFVKNWKGALQKIATVSKGYAYVDTGSTMRDAISLRDLKYEGLKNGKHIWQET